MKTNKYFASANSSNGFCNKFENIIDINNGGFLYIIKGGPGCGKSTFMNKIAQHFINLGQNIELFYCSSDNTSLDGIKMIEANVAVVDGTAPHITESAFPNTNSKILNFGEFISNAVSSKTNEIQFHSNKKQVSYKNLYKILSSIGEIYNYRIPIDNNLISSYYNNLVSLNVKDNGFIKRELFLSCISQNGLQTLNNDYEQVVELNCNLLEFNTIIDKYITFLEKNKISYTRFIDIFNLNYTEQLLITNSNIIIKRNNSFIINKNIDSIIELLINQASNELSVAKSHHSKIEEIYSTHINFPNLTFYCDSIINEICNRQKK